MNRDIRWPVLLLSLGVLSGCISLGATNIPPTPPNLQVSEKYPFDVALVVPESTRQIMTLTQIPSSCLGSTTPLVYAYGTTFKDIAAGAFAQMFSTVEVLPSSPTDKKYDLIIESSLTEWAFRAGCPISPGTFYRASGRVRLLDKDGRELWPGYQGTLNRDIGIGMWGPVNVDEDLGGLMADLVGQLARELRGSPQFVRFVSTYRKTPGQDRAVPQAGKGLATSREWAPALVTRDPAADEAFTSASAANTIAAYEEVLKQYPQSEHRPKALAAMAVLIKAGGSGGSEFKYFVKKYPDGAAYLPLEQGLGLIGPPGLTVQDIINQKKQGMADRLLVSKIKSSKGTYKDFSFDEIKMLHQKGLSDDIIEAMIESTTKARQAPWQEQRGNDDR